MLRGFESAGSVRSPRSNSQASGQTRTSRLRYKCPLRKMGGLGPPTRGEEIPVRLRLSAATLAALGAAMLVVLAGSASAASPPTYNINTLAGKVASLYGTAGLQIRFSALIEEEADADDVTAPTGAPISPVFVQSSPLDGIAIAPPAVTVNQDTAASASERDVDRGRPEQPEPRRRRRERLRLPNMGMHGLRYAVQRPRRGGLGHVLLERRRLDVVLHLDGPAAPRHDHSRYQQVDRRSVRRRWRPRGRFRQPRSRVLRGTRLRSHERAEHGGCEQGHLLRRQPQLERSRRSSTRRPRLPLSMTRSGSRSIRTPAVRSRTGSMSPGRASSSTRRTGAISSRRSRSPRRAMVARRSRRRS